MTNQTSLKYHSKWFDFVSVWCEGAQDEDADNSSEDEYLTQGQHFGIFHSGSGTEDMPMSEKQLLAQLSVPKERPINESLSRIACTTRNDPAAKHTTPG